ncbi:MAG TPA: type III-A CRISPR-associated protein Cas10/Csm1, partial [Bacteroidales bacterium]|nr:type III-A CRISPR-associated protein Cas10/Csm1 [Bacteroidales bacterium]
MTDNKRAEVYLAALLHDIGKFYQRADEGSVAKSKHLHSDIKKLEGIFCPEDKKIKGRSSHKHILWTAQFFKDFEPHLKGLVGSHNNEITIDRLMRLSAIHHNPSGNDLMELVIQKADHFSSGVDRSASEDAWKEAYEEESWDSFRKIRMRSIFEGVSLAENQGKSWSITYKKKLPLCKMQLTEKFFSPDEADVVPDYAGLWNDFVNEVKFIQTDSFKTFAETILFLLEKYTSRIPASTIHLPDVSLYDHAKTTAAFAVCLYDYVTGNSQQIPASDDKPFLLIGADLSGIQKFIYGIIARGAAKNLKGRSFYLQLLIDNIVDELVKVLGLFNANIVYKSGGGFYLLAPNTAKTREVISEFEKKILNQLFQYHKTDLFLAIDYIEFGEAELFSKTSDSNTNSIGEVWAELAKKIGARKSQRFINLFDKEGYKELFSPASITGDELVDELTGEEIQGNPVSYDGHKMNHYTKQQIILGEKLKNTKYWIHSEERLTYFPESAHEFNVIGLESYNYFVPKEFFDDRNNIDRLRKSADKVKAIAINDLDFLETPQKGINNIYGFAFYGGNEYPESKWYKAPKVFEEIAGAEFKDGDRECRSHTPGLFRLGIMRMDVDNLGAIFRRGLSPDKRSFSRYSVLSRSLDAFFGGYLNTIWKSNNDFRNFTQIIYSGGDDMFIIGKWDVLIEMAKVINAAFRKWTCNNPWLTLSGGIAIVYPKFPILKGAELSEKEEKNAKSHIFGNQEKNAFSIFGYAFEWDSEYEFLLSLKNQIKGLLKSGLSSGFSTAVYNLMQQAGFYFDKTAISFFRV